ncbi:MAG: methyltransferase [Kofleriaceae bacterium]
MRLHRAKTLDLIATAHRLGLLARLEAGPVTLATLAATTGALPLRLYAFLDGLARLGLVERIQHSGDVLAAEYVARAPLGPAFDAVATPWHLDDTRAAWPPGTEAEVAALERSMALGCGPIVEALQTSRALVFGGVTRWLDVGGDGMVTAAILETIPELHADVLELPAALPAGYDLISFVHVLHDWPADDARALLVEAKRALPAGGRLVIGEELRDADRPAAHRFLLGADVSRLRETSWYTSALARLDFSDIRVVRGPFDLIVARP